jgi:hypothetical protein
MKMASVLRGPELPGHYIPVIVVGGPVTYPVPIRSHEPLPVVRQKAERDLYCIQGIRVNRSKNTNRQIRP